MKLQEAVNHILKKLQIGLPAYLKYHSYEHTLSVIDSAKIIANAEGLKEPEFSLLITAAAYHDSGFLYTYDDHETASCNIVKKMLPNFGYTNQEISAILDIIIADKIPQSPTNLQEMVLCDADLDYLGGDNYEVISRLLFEELNQSGYSVTEKQWLDLQINFLTSHRYWTNFAINNRRPKKLIVLEELKKRKNPD